MSPSKILHLEQMIPKSRDTKELFLEATNMAASSGWLGKWRCQQECTKSRVQAPGWPCGHHQPQPPALSHSWVLAEGPVVLTMQLPWFLSISWTWFSEILRLPSHYPTSSPSILKGDSFTGKIKTIKKESLAFPSQIHEHTYICTAPSFLLDLQSRSLPTPLQKANPSFCSDLIPLLPSVGSFPSAFILCIYFLIKL